MSDKKKDPKKTAAPRSLEGLALVSSNPDNVEEVSAFFRCFVEEVINGELTPKDSKCLALLVIQFHAFITEKPVSDVCEDLIKEYEKGLQELEKDGPGEVVFEFGPKSGHECTDCGKCGERPKTPAKKETAPPPPPPQQHSEKMTILPNDFLDRT